MYKSIFILILKNVMMGGIRKDTAPTIDLEPNFIELFHTSPTSPLYRNNASDKILLPDQFYY